MSQLDDTLLDALTHVTFPKGFVSAEPASIVTVEHADVPIYNPAVAISTFCWRRLSSTAARNPAAPLPTTSASTCQIG